MVSLSRRLTVLETMTSSVDRRAISRLTDAELDVKIAAGEAEIVAAGGWDAFFGAHRDLAEQCRLLRRQIGRPALEGLDE